MKTRPSLVLSLLLLLLLAACTPVTPAPTEAATQPEPAETEQTLETVQFKAAVLPFLSFGPFFIAQEEGYFAEQGLEVEFIEFERGSDALAGLSTGDLDVWGGAVTAGLLNLVADNPDVQIVADRGYFREGDCGYTAFVVRPALMQDGDIASGEGLKGLNVVQDREGGLRDYLLAVLLEQQGLTLDDINAVTLPDPAVSEAMGAGEVDAASLGEPGVTRVINAGHGELYITADALLPDYQFGVLAFSKRLLQDEPEVGARFIAAYLKAVQQYSEGKTERNIEILAEATGLDATLLEQACWPAYREDGRVNAESIVGFQEWSVENTYMDAVIPVDALWNPQFVEAAAALLGDN